MPGTDQVNAKLVQPEEASLKEEKQEKAGGAESRSAKRIRWPEPSRLAGGSGKPRKINAALLRLVWVYLILHHVDELP